MIAREFTNRFGVHQNLKAQQLQFFPTSAESAAEEKKKMVLVILGAIQFEADKFETRTMPTPDMKDKEMIYWIRLKTADRRLISDLRRFLEGSGRYVDLRVPGAFIWAKTEIEDLRFPPDLQARDDHSRRAAGASRELEERLDEQQSFTVEIVLRRLVGERPKGQSPYG